MPKASFVWKEEWGGARNSGFSAELGNVTYHVSSRDYGYPAYVEARARGVCGTIHRHWDFSAGCPEHLMLNIAA